MAIDSARPAWWIGADGRAYKVGSDGVTKVWTHVGRGHYEYMAFKPKTKGEAAGASFAREDT